MALTEKYANFDLATGANDGSSEANAWQSWAAITFAPGERVNFKRCASRKNIGSVTMSTSGTTGNPVWLRGYTSTIGDGGLFHFTGNLTISGNTVYLQHLDGVSTTDSAVCTLTGKASLLLSRMDQQSTGSVASYAVNANDGGSVLFCWLKSASTGTTDSSHCCLRLQRGSAYGCYVVGSGASAAVWLGTNFRSAQIARSVIDANGDIGALIDSASGIAGPVGVTGCSIYDASDGIQLNASPDVGDTGWVDLLNNIIYQCSGYGINLADTDANQITLAGNAMGAVTSGRTNGLQNIEEIGGITLTADPFTDAANGDFRLNTTAGGGALCGAAALPTDINLDGTVDNYLDLGALQSQASAASGPSVVLNAFGEPVLPGRAF